MNYGHWVEVNETHLMEEFSDKYSDLFIQWLWADKNRLYAFFDAHKEKFEKFCNWRYEVEEGEAA